MNGLAHAENILWSHAEVIVISRKDAERRKEIFLKIKTSRNFAALREI